MKVDCTTSIALCKLFFWRNVNSGLSWTEEERRGSGGGGGGGGGGRNGAIANFPSELEQEREKCRSGGEREEET